MTFSIHHVPQDFLTNSPNTKVNYISVSRSMFKCQSSKGKVKVRSHAIEKINMATNSCHDVFVIPQDYSTTVVRILNAFFTFTIII